MVQQVELQVYARRAALPLAMAGGMEQQSAQRPEPTPAMALQVASPPAVVQQQESPPPCAQRAALLPVAAEEMKWR